MRLKLFESEGFFYRPIRVHSIQICACRFNIHANLMRMNLKAISISAYHIKICACCLNMRALLHQDSCWSCVHKSKSSLDVEEPFIFKFEYDEIYMLLMKGKMGIYKFRMSFNIKKNKVGIFVSFWSLKGKICNFKFRRGST